ncbi:hypothetical protein C8F04DRAFT_1256809 [Mycena alexandri]|uniref:Uncharacterized protein n=1 Tax=Mycena alexandri TaxID=1745969 RepID=A0AAD6T1U8_9AGAR|nr:hypothetical protein C8F04DRAFT_1256809 [Mycena alexandri]
MADPDALRTLTDIMQLVDTVLPRMRTFNHTQPGRQKLLSDLESLRPVLSDLQHRVVADQGSNKLLEAKPLIEFKTSMRRLVQKLPKLTLWHHNWSRQEVNEFVDAVATFRTVVNFWLPLDPRAQSTPAAFHKSVIEHGGALTEVSESDQESIAQLPLKLVIDARAAVAASEDGDEKIIELFTQHDVVPNALALVAAARGGHQSIVQVLLAHGVDADAGALVAASEGGHESIVQVLLAHGAIPDASILMAAAGGGNENIGGGYQSIIELLIKHGAVPNASVLMAAARGGNEIIVSLLIKHGAVPDASVLMVAAGGGYQSIIELLIKHGARRAGYQSIIELLIKHGAVPDASILMRAAEGGYQNVVALLIEHGVVPTASALMAAIRSGNKPILKLLIAHGVDVDASALSAASHSGHESIIELLATVVREGPVKAEIDALTPADLNSEPSQVSTFVICSPKSARDQAPNNASFSSEDIQKLRNEYANGGSTVVVYRPEAASRNLGGPIAAMLAPDSPCLVIFGSIHDGWVLKAAKLLADESQFAVMIRSPSDNPIPTWERQGRPFGVPVVDLHTAEMTQGDEDFLITIQEDNNLDDVDYISITDSSESTASTADDDDDTGDLNTGGVLRLRGGAGEEKLYDPWFGPVHDVDVLLQVHPTIGNPYQVDLRTKIRFKTQPEYENRLRHGMECSEFIPPRTTAKMIHISTQGTTTSLTLTGGGSLMGGGANLTGTAGYAENDIQTDTIERQNDRITPKCKVYYQPGKRVEVDDTISEPFQIAYEATEDFNNNSKYPMDVQFSVGVHVVDREAVNDPGSTLPDIPDLPTTSFLIMNQTNLWMNSDLKSERQGILVLTVAHLPDVHSRAKISVLEKQTVKMGNNSPDVPTDTEPGKYRAKMSVAATTLPSEDKAVKPGIFKKLKNAAAVRSFLRRKTVPPSPKIENLFMHEFIARGWDLRLNEWRKQMYPSLTHTFRRVAPESSNVPVWQVVVEDRAPKAKGKHREQAPDPLEGQIPASTTDQGEGILSDAGSAAGSQQTSGYADTATSVTSLGTRVAATGGLIIPAYTQVAETTAGPSNSK